MSAIAGLVGFDRSSASRTCAEMLGRLKALGPDRAKARDLGDATFGHAQRRLLSEDRFDVQPLIGSNGMLLLVADVRIDNREDLSGALGLGTGECRETSDSGLLLAVWERWQLGCIDRLVGDYAFAVWSQSERRLTLVRGPMAMKTLFFHHSPGRIAFATLPMALFAAPGIDKHLNREEAARLAAGIHWSDETLFEGVRKVEHGHAVIADRYGWHAQRIWHLEAGLAPASIAEAGEGLRFELDRAVRARLRRSHGQVGAQLSAGRDSSAVATSAALALQETGEPLVVLTGAPRLGFTDPSLGDILFDESAIAARTAALYPNMIHRICRAEPAMVAPDFDMAHRHHFRPMLNSSSAGWSNATYREAARLDVTVMLTGSRGNFSISRGGFDALGQLWDELGPRDWLAASRSTRDNPGLAWRTIASLTFGSRLPQSLFGAALRASGRGPAPRILPMLRGDLRERAEQLANEDADLRPPRSFASYVREMIYQTDNSDQAILAEWGIDERDPTADRRVVEYCYSLTASQLLSPFSPRPAYQAAFGDRVPAEVMEGRRRGFQGADWLELYCPDYVRPALLAYARNPLVADLIDIPAAERLFAQWPSEGSRSAETLQFGRHLLNSVALAGFIAQHFD